MYIKYNIYILYFDVARSNVFHRKIVHVGRYHHHLTWVPRRLELVRMSADVVPFERSSVKLDHTIREIGSDLKSRPSSFES
jgi:hypothetical protein